MRFLAHWPHFQSAEWVMGLRAWWNCSQEREWVMGQEVPAWPPLGAGCPWRDFAHFFYYFSRVPHTGWRWWGGDSNPQPDGRVCSAVPESLCTGFLLWPPLPLSVSPSLLPCHSLSFTPSVSPFSVSVSPSISVCPCLCLCLCLSLSDSPSSVCVSLSFSVSGSVSLDPPPLCVCAGFSSSLCLSFSPLSLSVFDFVSISVSLPLSVSQSPCHMSVSLFQSLSPSPTLSLPPLLSFGERRDTFP